MWPHCQPRHQHVGHKSPAVLSEVSPGTFCVGSGTFHVGCSSHAPRTGKKLPACAWLVTHMWLFSWTQRLIRSSEKFQPQQLVLWHFVLNMGIADSTNLDSFGGRAGWEFVACLTAAPSWSRHREGFLWFLPKSLLHSHQCGHCYCPQSSRDKCASPLPSHAASWHL